jgi:hypothetical protein
MTRRTPNRVRGHQHQGLLPAGAENGVGETLKAGSRRIRDGVGIRSHLWTRDASFTNKGRSPTMLWTILVVLVIVALALFIFRNIRGR